MKKAKQKKVIKLVAPVCVAGMMITPGVFAASPKASNAVPASKSEGSKIPLATGSGVTKLPEVKGPFFNIADYGASTTANGVQNQKAIDAAINAAAARGGGTVVIPSGDFKTYTIHLKSNVNIHFAAKNSIIRAAIPGTDGGYYDAPEASPWIGLEDEGHAHFANSLIYGKDIENVMISGPGLITGSQIDANGKEVPVLQHTDIPEAQSRTEAGVPDGANKAIAIAGGKNIIMRDFNMRYGGHFAIYGSGITNWTLDGMIVDSNRDGIDIDCSQNVTIRNSIYNTVDDDAIVLKSTFSLGKIIPTKNVLVENNKVMGYDTGSVLDGTYSQTQKLEQPTARIKLGTEATGGFDRVTINNNYFEHSRGFAIEEVDGAKTSNIVFKNAVMKDVTNSPIYIRLGDRDRTPVTGNNADENVPQQNNVRVDNGIFTLPNIPAKYGYYPAQRFSPSYNKTATASVGGGSDIKIVDPTNPTNLNPNSIRPNNPLYANAIGAKDYSTLENVSISNVKVTDADPRFPMQIDGLVDHSIKNVSINNIDVQYRGGLSMQDAVEQRQLKQTITLPQYLRPAATQTFSWFDTGSAKNEALLPRIKWDPKTNAWVNDPYNVPEMPFEYPEPEDFGVLPAYGMYARHVDNLTVNNMNLSYMTKDSRPAVVLDDVANSAFHQVNAETEKGVPEFVKVTNTKKRTALDEYVQNMPYKTTTVDAKLPKDASVQNVTVDNPAPGTPTDSLYQYPTAPSTAYPYSYAVPNSSLPLPATVHRPFFDAIGTQTVQAGKTLQFTMNGEDPIPNAVLTYSAKNLPDGATFDPTTKLFTWTPSTKQVGNYQVTFVLNDGVLPESRTVDISVVR